ncbi:MAG: flagellar export chaperone FliS [Acidobacteriota bacterium]
MYGSSKAASLYNKVSNLETNRLQQIVMLYDGAIKFLRLAATDIEAKDINAKAEHIDRALDILNYLQSILDYQHGAEVAQTLDIFYTTIMTMVLKASLQLDAGQVRRAADLLVPVCEAWAINAAALPAK